MPTGYATFDVSSQHFPGKSTIFHKYSIHYPNGERERKINIHWNEPLWVEGADIATAASIGQLNASKTIAHAKYLNSISIYRVLSVSSTQIEIDRRLTTDDHGKHVVCIYAFQNRTLFDVNMNAIIRWTYTSHSLSYAHIHTRAYTFYVRLCTWRDSLITLQSRMNFTTESLMISNVVINSILDIHSFSVLFNLIGEWILNGIYSGMWLWEEVVDAIELEMLVFNHISWNQ